MFLFLVSLYLIAFVVASRAYALYEGFWGPVTLFGIGAFYYYLAVPIEIHLKGQEIHSVFPAVSYLPNETRVAIAIATLIAFVGFVAGHHASGLHQMVSRLKSSTQEPMPRSLIYLVLAVSVILLVVYGHLMMVKLSYQEANELRYNDAFYSFNTRILVLTSGLIIGVLAHQGKLLRGWGLAVPIALIAWGFFTSDKNPLLVTAMGVGALWVGKRSKSLSHLGLYCSGTVAVAVLLPVFSLVRADVAPDWASVLSVFTLEYQEANGPMLSLASAMSGQEEPLWGSSYLYAVVSWIPRSVWPGRPEDLAQVFAAENLPTWYPGMGLGYSLLAEAYLNFGYVGIFFQYFATAFFLDRLWIAIYPLCVRCRATSFWVASMSVIYFQLLVMMHRGPISQVLQICMREMVIFLVLLYIFDRKINRPSSTLNRGRTIPNRSARFPSKPTGARQTGRKAA